LQITELPIGNWTQSYKEFLETLMVASDKTPAAIKDYKEHHTDTTVSFTISFEDDQMAAALASDLYKKFKLESTISTTNLVEPEFTRSICILPFTLLFRF
jgi:DNA topoisomerase II